MAANVYKCSLQRFSALCHRAVRPAQVLLAVLLDQIVLQQLLVLKHAMLALDFVFLVSAPGTAEVADNTRVHLALELVALQELGFLMAVAEEQRHGAHLLALLLGLVAVLHHRPEGRDARAQSHHDIRHVRCVWDGNAARVHVAVRQLGQLVLVFQVVRCQSMSLPALGVLPVVVDDA